MTLKSDAFKDVLRTENIILWLILAFQAGFINAAGFLACHRFVSHMTGFGTQFGLALGEGDPMGAFEMFLAPISFIVGSIVSGLLIDKRVFQGKEAHVRTSTIIQFALILVVLIGGTFNLFGQFGEPLILQRDYFLLLILCFLCGLQNSTFTTLTAGQIRTTHLTGLSTDIGINLVRNYYINNISDQKRRELINVNWLRIYTFTSFFVGSAISAIVMMVGDYQGFILPAGTSLIIVFYVHFLMYHKYNEDPHARDERKLQA